MADDFNLTASEITDLGDVCDGTAGAGGADLDLFGLQPPAPELNAE